MTGAILPLLLALSPLTRLHVTSTRGVVDIPLVQQRGEGPLLSLSALANAMSGTILRDPVWVTLQIAGARFRFLAGTPLVEVDAGLRGMAGASHTRGDSLMVPLAFVADVLGDPRRSGWKWSPASGTLTEAAGSAALRPARPAAASLMSNGLRRGHHVTIDPGHGGTDPGNPGMFFPRGLKEKNVTLAVGLLVRDELVRNGVSVTMTRATDTLINLEQRAPRYCTGNCDLFASIHVNSLEPRSGFTQVRGFETYFLSEARSADAARVARMENSAVKFDRPGSDDTSGGDLAFMFKDLENNEYLRESQRAAALIQSLLSEVHDGPDHGVKQAGFAVLRTARHPAVLIEMGYATNRDDAQLMTTPSGQRDLAAAIARAIIRYLQAYDRETADTSTGSGG